MEMFKRAKLLRIHLEEVLNADFYINTLIKKASKKYFYIASVGNYMNLSKRLSKVNTFVVSKFSSSSYCLDILLQDCKLYMDIFRYK